MVPPLTWKAKVTPPAAAVRDNQKDGQRVLLHPASMKFGFLFNCVFFIEIFTRERLLTYSDTILAIMPLWKILCFTAF